MFNSRVLGGILLVSGTAIGAGMLALPTSTAESGFIPSAVAFIICWIFMTLAAFLLLEVNLWLPGENDILSMINETLGKHVKWGAWGLYLMLLYALIAAYFKGSSAWLTNLGVAHSGVALGIVVFTTAIIVSHGTALTENTNRYLVVGLVVAYLVLVTSALPKVDVPKITVTDWSSLPFGFPLLITAFGYSVVLPSLTNYLNRDVKALRIVIVFGGLLPLVIYILWELVSLGIIPMEGENGLRVLKAHYDDGTGVALALERLVGNPWISQSSRWFSIFAILTSLLGASLALFHFLADGLHLKPEKGFNRFYLSLLTFLPPLAIVLFYPSGFGRILSFAGTLVAILMGLIPALMAWWGRYHQTIVHTGYRVFGGRGLILAVILFFSYVVLMEVLSWIIPLLS